METKESLPVTRTVSAVPAMGQTNRLSEIDEIMPQIAGWKYPITTREDLVTRLAPGHSYFYRGKKIKAEQKIAKMPASFFPITSEDDFRAKLTTNIKPRPPVKIDPVIEIKRHPISVKAPTGSKGSGK